MAVIILLVLVNTGMDNPAVAVAELAGLVILSAISMVDQEFRGKVLLVGIKLLAGLAVLVAAALLLLVQTNHQIKMEAMAGLEKRLQFLAAHMLAVVAAVQALVQLAEQAAQGVEVTVEYLAGEVVMLR